MSKQFLDLTGLNHVWQQINNLFQRKLVSGTNIKTINNQSLVGSGNLNIGTTDVSQFISKNGGGHILEELDEDGERYNNGGIYLDYTIADNDHPCISVFGDGYGKDAGVVKLGKYDSSISGKDQPGLTIIDDSGMEVVNINYDGIYLNGDNGESYSNIYLNGKKIVIDEALTTEELTRVLV